jgi:hypothetical protein
MVVSLSPLFLNSKSLTSCHGYWQILHVQYGGFWGWYEHVEINGSLTIDCKDYWMDENVVAMMQQAT